MDDAGLPHERVRFAHNSERQFAKLLDFYGIAWEYEPVEFTLERTRDGEASAAFRPDFYLPDYDLFIEITTLNQKLVTKKNRKVRRLRELHPEVKVKVLYQRDYMNLLVKYQLEQPSQLVEVVSESDESRLLVFDPNEPTVVPDTPRRSPGATRGAPPSKGITPADGERRRLAP